MLTLITLFIVSQSLPAAKDTPDAACTTDSQCIISTTACCPGCCGGGPYATSIDAEKKMQDRCARVRCRIEPCDKQCEAPMSAEALEARCVRKVCVARLKKK